MCCKSDKVKQHRIERSICIKTWFDKSNLTIQEIMKLTFIAHFDRPQLQNTQFPSLSCPKRLVDEKIDENVQQSAAISKKTAYANLCRIYYVTS